MIIQRNMIEKLMKRNKTNTKKKHVAKDECKPSVAYLAVINLHIAYYFIPGA